jgi:hypothetical protein
MCGPSPYVTSSLTRGWVCRLQFLLVLASAVIRRSESHGTHDHILLSQIRESPNLEGQVPIFISTRNRVVRLYPQTLGSLFVASYDLLGYGGGIWPCLHTRCNNRGIVTKWDVMRTAIAMEQLSKHVSVETITCNNRRAVLSVWSMPRGYKEDKDDHLSQLSFETPPCQDVSLGTEESRDGIELRNWGIRVIQCSSVELNIGLWRKDFMCAAVTMRLV